MSILLSILCLYVCTLLFITFFVDYVLWYLIADGILGHDFSRRRWVFPVALAALRFARVMKLQLFVTGEEDWASWYIFKPWWAKMIRLADILLSTQFVYFSIFNFCAVLCILYIIIIYIIDSY